MDHTTQINTFLVKIKEFYQCYIRWYILLPLCFKWLTFISSTIHLLTIVI
jgi:hypothetical protein